MARIIILCFFLLLSACSSSDTNTTNLTAELPQTWQLVQINTGLSGMILQGDELPWQETILLNADSTFAKTRILDDQTFTANGAFELPSQESMQQLLLAYNEESLLIVNCSASNEELLQFISANELSGSALPCDGLGVLYERVE